MAKLFLPKLMVENRTPATLPPLNKIIHMAKKALFHEIITKSGHGLRTHILPARRAEDLIELLQSDTVKVESSRSLGWKDVQIMICSGGVFFESELGRYWYGDDGFDYLAEQFGPAYRAALRELS